MLRKGNFIKILDTTCRDGMHAVAHQFSTDQIAALAKGLNKACVDLIEISHGDGLGGHSINYGFGAVSEEDWLKAAKKELTKTKMGFLLLPGIGTMKDIDMAAACGATFGRIAVHCTEANISAQHIHLCKNYNMLVIGALMMTHMIDANQLLEQAKILEGYGVDYVYCMDSAGHLLPDGVIERVGLLAEKLSIPVGFHAHQNLGLAVANTIAAVKAGASMIDGTLRGLGAGAGNTPTEVITTVLELLGYETNVDLYSIMDASEDILAPMGLRQPVIDKSALTIGYAGVYSSFMLHANRAAQRYALDPRDILIELGKRKVIGGQEDMIVQVAIELSKRNK